MLNNEHQYLYLDTLTSPISCCNDFGISRYCACRINRPIGYVWVIMLILSSQCCPNQAYLPQSLTIGRDAVLAHILRIERHAVLCGLFIFLYLYNVQRFFYISCYFIILKQRYVYLLEKGILKNYNHNTCTTIYILCNLTNFLWCNAHTYIIPPTIYMHMYQIPVYGSQMKSLFLFVNNF